MSDRRNLEIHFPISLVKKMFHYKTFVFNPRNSKTTSYFGTILINPRVFCISGLQ